MFMAKDFKRPGEMGKSAGIRPMGRVLAVELTPDDFGKVAGAESGSYTGAHKSFDVEYNDHNVND